MLLPSMAGILQVLRIGVHQPSARSVQFECKYYQTIVLPGGMSETNRHFVIGRVIGVHIADEVIGEDGRHDICRIQPLARLGYMDYVWVEDAVELTPIGIVSEALMRSYAGGLANRERNPV